MQERGNTWAITHITFAKSMFENHKQTYHYHNHPDFCYFLYSRMNIQYFTFAPLLHIEAFKILKQSTLHIYNQITFDHWEKKDAKVSVENNKNVM